jgi:iron(III) transport system permease protein
VPSLVIGLLLLTPIAYLILRSWEAGDEVWNLVFRARSATVLWNTIRLAVSVGITTVALAVPLAWLVTRTDLKFRRFWATLLALPLVIPSYAGALAVIGALGPRGFVQGWLEPFGVDRLPSIYGFFGAWALLSLFTYPYVFLTVRSMISRMDPSLEEAAMNLGRGPVKTFLTITVPRLRPAIAAGVLLSMLYTISDFGVVTLMRYDAFTRVIYTQYSASFDRTYAAVLGLFLVVLAMVLVWLESRVRREARYHRIGSGTPRLPRSVKLGKMQPVALFCTTLVAILSMGIPVGALLYWAIIGASTGDVSGRVLQSLGNSVLLAVLVATTATMLALPIAYMAARFPDWRSTMVERLTYVGYALPGIVVALAFVFMGTRILLPIYQTVALLVIALAIRLIPESVGSTKSSLLQINPHLEEASRCLGCNLYESVRRVSWPLARPGIAAGAALVFLTVMKELPITLLLRPTGFTTLATDIWSATGTGQYGKAAVSSLVLIGLSAVPTALLVGRQSSQARGRG